MKPLDYSGRSPAFEAQKMVADSVDRNMRSLIQAWDKEIEAAFEALRARGKQLEEEKKAELLEQSRAAHERAADEALTASIAGYLASVAASVEGASSKSASAPSGVPATSGVLGGILDELLANVENEVRENWGESALGQAFDSKLLPAPQDMAFLMDRAGDLAWSERFNGIAAGLERLEGLPASHPQLQGHIGHERIDLLKDYSLCLQSYGAQRLASAILRPGDVAALGPSGAPPALSTQAAGIPDYLKKALDDFGAKPTTLGTPVSAADASTGASSTGLRRPVQKHNVS